MNENEVGRKKMKWGEKKRSGIKDGMKGNEVRQMEIK